MPFFNQLGNIKSRTFQTKKEKWDAKFAPTKKDFSLCVNACLADLRSILWSYWRTKSGYHQLLIKLPIGDAGMNESAVAAQR